MVPKEVALEDENSASSPRTSESSDSYSYLLHDLDFDTPGNRITEEWEAIERTLYQESGKHVTDPILLKECKLWRETFPHIRVTGTAIKGNEESGCAEETKYIEVKDKNLLALSKINEKREKIKKAVVSQIVERLINKLSLNTENQSGINNRIIELNGKYDKKPVSDMKSFGLKQEKESYFERGKNVEFNTDTVLRYGNRTADRDLSDLFDDFEYDFSFESNKRGNSVAMSNLWSGSNSSQGKESITTLAKNEEIMRSENLKFKVAEKNTTRVKNEKSSDSLSNVTKPFEAIKKIDKKYEAMLERILENKGIQDNKGSPKSKDPLEKKRELKDTRKSKQLPKINNFTNNWLSRAEQNRPESYGYESIGMNYLNKNYENTIKNLEKQFKSQSRRRSSNISLLEEKFFQELRTEMNEYAISTKKNYEEEINFRRPRLNNRYNQINTAKTQKSLSCSDLPKNNQKPKINRVSKNSLEKGKSELIVKNGGKKTEKKKGNQNVEFPPIETSIICTEIMSRPKVTMRTFPKKFL